MAHEVENMMYVGEKPWHGLGIPLENPPSIEEAIRLAGLDWSVRCNPAYRLETIDPDGVPNFEEVDAQVVVREDTNAVLSVVGPAYTPLQNEDAFGWFDPFIESGLATLETAGSLRDGQRVWVMAKIQTDNSEIVKNDEIAKYILLSNGHDGKMSARAGFTPERVVCANTLAWAHDSAQSALIRVRHTAGIKDTIEELREVMNMADQSFEATADQFRSLAKRDVNQKDLEKYIKVVFKLRPSTNDEIDKNLIAFEENEMKRTMGKILPLFENGRGTDIKGVRGTWWGAYNAVTEYLTWESGRNQDNRLNNLWFGSGQRTNRQALDAALKMSA